MKVYIVCKVPTAYQSSSVFKLMGTVSINGMTGEVWAKQEFQNKKEAIQWLNDKAYSLYSDGTFEAWEHKEAMQEIKKYGSLTYDAATARIESVK